MEPTQTSMAADDPRTRYRDARVLVLGASGFIGRWVSRLLCQSGARVHLVVRDARAAEAVFERYGVEGRAVELDLSRAGGSLAALVREVRPSITFNLAGYGVDPAERDEGAAYAINEDLVRGLCAAVSGMRHAHWGGQDLIHVGSALEYGELGGDLAENAVPHPTTLYGKTKLAGTEALRAACRTQGTRALTARLFMVYGPGEHAGRLLPALIETAGSRRPLKLTAGKQQRDFTYVEDAAEGLLRLGASGPTEERVVNLATGRLTTVRRFVETASLILSIPAERLQFGALDLREEEMAHGPVTVERLRRISGWVPPTSIEEGIRRTRDFLGRAERT